MFRIIFSLGIPIIFLVCLGGCLNAGFTSKVIEGNDQLLSSGNSEPSAIELPIEVFGEKGGYEEVTFSIDSPEGVDHLWIQCHRCSYADALKNSQRGAKVSIQLNAESWIDLTNAIAQSEYPESKYGGVSGPLHTVRLQIPIIGVKKGENKLRFRFNGTDGISSGFRILAFNFLKNGEKQLNEKAFYEDDPIKWKPPLPQSDDLEKGRKLWLKENILAENPDSNKILRASCSSCHSSGGEDLKYFNYSNKSIVARSQHHRLSRREGEQIASYIRSRSSPAPVQARPWNPPYQPGPGLDSRPIEEWAAGAGLKWVLKDDSEMLPFLFSQGTSTSAIKKVISSRATLNVREMPIALQLPDWNAWLPTVHPSEDKYWGKSFTDTNVYQAYKNVTLAFENGGAETLLQPNSIKTKALVNTLDPLRQSVDDFFDMGGPQPCLGMGVHGSAGFALLGKPKAIPSKASRGDPEVCEGPLQSIAHWNAVKHWEIMQRFHLEGAPKKVYPYGEARGWVGTNRQVFDLAPHRIGNDSQTFTHLTKAEGFYFNTAWYQLQVILNAGNRNPSGHRPPDWKYQMEHLWASSVSNDHRQTLRYVQTLIKMQQNLDMRPPEGSTEIASYFPVNFVKDRGPNPSGWWILHVNPWRFISIGDAFLYDSGTRFQVWDQLNDIQPGLKNKIQNALLEDWLNKTETYKMSDFVRKNADGAINPLDYVPTPYTKDRDLIATGKMIADGIFRSIPYMREDGMDASLIERLKNWGQAMWPKGNWSAQ